MADDPPPLGDWVDVPFVTRNSTWGLSEGESKLVLRYFQPWSIRDRWLHPHPRADGRVDEGGVVVIYETDDCAAFLDTEGSDDDGEEDES